MMNGGLSKPSYELFCPKTQLIDTINFLPKKAIPDEIFLKEKYLEECLSINEISLNTFSSKATISRKISKLNIPKNDADRRVSGTHVYGYKKFCKRSVIMKKEQNVIELIRNYKLQGYSYQRIASKLNEKNIRTKLGKGAWHPKVIRQIYMRVVSLEKK